MARRIINPFAENGDRTAVADSTQSNGVVSYEQGYGPQYSLNPATDPSSRRIGRDPHNQIFHDLSSNIKEWQEQLAPNFITAANNGGTAFSYPLGMVVWDGTGYRRSTSANNTAVVTDDANWEDYDFSGEDVSGTPVVVALLQMAANVGGGDATSGQWRDIPLNVLETNPSGVTLSSGVVQNVPAGDYTASGFQVFGDVTGAQVRLYDKTNNVTLADATSLNTPSPALNDTINTYSLFMDRNITLAAATNVALQYQVQTTVNGNGLGEGRPFSEQSTFGTFSLRRN